MSGVEQESQREWERARELDERLGVLIAQQHAIGAEIVGCLVELDAIDGWQGVPGIGPWRSGCRPGAGSR